MIKAFPLPSVLFVVFLVLKLTGHIAWSWWWVTAPLWSVFVLVLVIAIAREATMTREQRIRRALRENGWIK